MVSVVVVDALLVVGSVEGVARMLVEELKEATAVGIVVVASVLVVNIIAVVGFTEVVAAIVVEGLVDILAAAVVEGSIEVAVLPFVVIGSVEEAVVPVFIVASKVLL